MRQRPLSQDRLNRGRRAEELAVVHLQTRGLRIVVRNWRRREGEIDIVADDKGVCVFVEVRSRTGVEQGHPLETVTPHKRAQIIRTARLYLQEPPPGAPAAAGFRFDVVGVTFSGEGDVVECVHVEDAFQVEG